MKSNTFVGVFICTCLCVVSAVSSPDDPVKPSKSALASIFVDDVLVESTLSVKRKPSERQGRQQTNTAVLNFPKRIEGSPLSKLQRAKRQSRRRYQGFDNQYYPQGDLFQGGFPQQNSFPQQNFGNFPQFQPIRGSASNAQAQAQGFQSNSPFGNFGASAANAGSQGFSYDENGFSGNAGLSGSQSYNLPNGQTLAISYANGFSIGPDGKPTITRGNSIAYTGADGKPIPGYGYNPDE